MLDEQRLGRNLEREIAHWYRGTVRSLIDLRPNTIIKDDAVPDLLLGHIACPLLTVGRIPLR